MRRTRVAIDLPALRHNLQRAREAAPGSRVMAAIKANGYGHGLLRVARALTEADGFGVACLGEALALREAGIRAPVTLLEGFFEPQELGQIAEHRLGALIHSPEQLAALEHAKGIAPIDAWLKVDSGMHRLGFSPAATADAFRRLAAAPAVGRVVGCMTHLACADDRDDPTTRRQLETFGSATQGLPGLRAIANSAGVLGWPQSHSDWVRPGIMLYGVSPFIGGRGPAEGLRPAMTFHSEIIAVNTVPAGDAVGYGGTWVCPRETRVGVVAAGYGDGYPRHAPSGTPVLVNGHRARLIGRVSMDMITVDLSDLPEAAVGDPVVLWGEGLPVEEIAESAGTIAYELLCGITRRVAVEERT